MSEAPDRLLAARDPRSPLGRAHHYLEATLVVALGTVLALALQRLPHANLSLVYLTGVLLVAVRCGLWPSIYASVLSFLAFNYLFTTPLFTLAVQEQGDIATLLFFLITATITGNLAARMRSGMRESREALERISNLYDFAARVAGAATPEAIGDHLTGHLWRTLGLASRVYLEDAGGRLGEVAHGGDDAVVPDPAELTRAWKAGALQADPWHYFGLAGTSRAGARHGLAAVHAPGVDAETLRLLDHLAAQTGAGIDRARLAAELDAARLAAETERLRASLLSSVSHDLKTPLASIIGSVSTLTEYGHAIGEQDRRDLLVTVLEEAERLQRYIENLLEMARLQNRRLGLARDWVDAGDLIAACRDRLEGPLERVRLEIDVAPGVRLLYAHGALLEQALFNVLENAVRHSPEGAPVTIEVHEEGDDVVFDVIDRGPGIPEADRERIFDRFFSEPRGDRTRRGTGLGLTIARAFVGAHGGSVTAHDGPGGAGTRIRIRLPRAPGGAAPKPDAGRPDAD